MSAAVLWVLLLLPAAVGAVLALGGRRVAAVAAPVSVTTAALSLVLGVVVAVARPASEVPFVAGAPVAVAVDDLAAVVLVAVLAVTLLVLVFAAADVTEDRGRFHGLMLVFAASVSVTVTAASLPALLIAWEVMGAMSYALVGFRWQDRERVSAGATAFVTTRTADLGLYVAAAAALAGSGSLSLADLPDASPGWRSVAAGGILVAALGKAAQLPFSFWLSRAMAGPSAVSALLHSAAMVAMGGYLLLRSSDLLAATGWADDVAAWTGASTALLLGVVALAQRDLKQLLAASTSAQLGFVVLAAGLGGVAAGTGHLVAHAATKALLFLAAGAWLTALGTKALPGLRGVARRWPLAGTAAVIGSLALAGVAPLSLWATKDEVLVLALEQSVLLYLVALAASALSAGYAGRLLLTVWRDRPADETTWDEEETGTRGVPALAQGPLVVLAVGAALLGLLVLPPGGTALREALGESGVPTAGPVELGLSAVLAVAVLAAVARWGAPAPRWAAAWLHLEPAADLLVVRPTMRAAHALARFDVRVVDRAVDGLAAGSVALARMAGRLDERRVTGAMTGLARAVRRLAAQARRPQTGQLHEYYLQAVAVLAVAVLVVAVVR
jgi:NADH:ubiquinone oxidoreductase subunit 5 (subunit L)/multisubunit Na+/H+ antiporter MnhA subunit